MERFWLFFQNKFNFTYLLTIALVLAGFLAIIAIPKESAPEVRIPIAVVTTILPGASASDIEQLITIPIEDKLASALSDVKQITSTSREGVSSVVVEFLADADLDESIQETKDTVDTVSDLPDDASEPVVSEVNFVDQPIVDFSISSSLPPIELLELSEYIESEIEKISGVARVSIGGVAGREVQVVVDQSALSKFDLSLSEVSLALSRANQSIPIGGVIIDGVEYAIKYNGDIEEVTDIANLPVVSRGGFPVYVKDIAFVSSGLADNKSISRLWVGEGSPQQAVSFSVFKQAGADVTRVSNNVVALLDEMREGVLADSDVLVLFNTGDDVAQDLRQLSLSGFQTVILVVLVLLLALGKREAWLAGLSIPMSFLLSFIALNATGNTINFVSLFSLILAVGILVDSAIVVTEGVYTKLKEGHSKLEATRLAIVELHWPIVAGTMTTIAVFFPLFFISGVTGKFIASIPFTIIFVLLASLFVALALLPVFARRYLSATRGHSGGFSKKRDLITLRIQGWYKKLLNNLIGNVKKEKYLKRGIVLLLVISLVLPFSGLVSVIFFPAEDSEYLFIDISLEQGTVLANTDFTVREVEDILMSIKEVESFVSTIGSGSSFTSGGSGGNIANVSATLKPKRQRSSQEISDFIRQEVSRKLPNVEVRVAELSSGPPVGAPISVTLLGDDPDDLQQFATEAMSILEGLEGVFAVDSSLADDGLEFELGVDRDQVSRAGLDVATIGGSLRSSLFGIEATDIRIGDDDVPVRVRLGLNPRVIDLRDSVETTVSDLQNLSIKNNSGDTVLLGSVLNTKVVPANAVIERRDQQRKVDVTGDVSEGFNVREIAADFKKQLESSANLPESVTLDFGGENEETNQSFADMGLALIYGIILMIAVLVLQFNSFRKTFIIISILPFILIGIFFGLAISGQALSFPAIMGFIAVAGIAVNNSIILVDVMDSLKKNNTRMGNKDIVVEGGVQRLRPILLTTLTTVIGVVPLTYASAIWAPLAWSIIFGLTFSVVLTLVLVPVLYYGYLNKLNK